LLFFLVEVVGDQTKVLLLALLESRILISLGVIYISELTLAEENKTLRVVSQYYFRTEFRGTTEVELVKETERLLTISHHSSIGNSKYLAPGQMLYDITAQRTRVFVMSRL
jgi:hypothetical protein